MVQQKYRDLNPIPPFLRLETLAIPLTPLYLICELVYPTKKCLAQCQAHSKGLATGGCLKSRWKASCSSITWEVIRHGHA